MLEPVLIGGQWRAAQHEGSLRAVNPATGESAMKLGGPFPATGHPNFTAVGIPASLRRFAMLECYDNVRPNRLPPWLQDVPPNDRMWRLIDGKWNQGAVR